MPVLPVNKSCRFSSHVSTMVLFAQLLLIMVLPVQSDQIALTTHISQYRLIDKAKPHVVGFVSDDNDQDRELSAAHYSVIDSSIGFIGYELRYNGNNWETSSHEVHRGVWPDQDMPEATIRLGENPYRSQWAIIAPGIALLAISTLVPVLELDLDKEIEGVPTFLMISSGFFVAGAITLPIGIHLRRPYTNWEKRFEQRDHND